MNWYKQSRYFPINLEDDMGDWDERSDMDIYDAAEQADNVFKSTKITPNPRKQLSEVVMPDKEDKVIGALSAEWEKVSGEADKDIWEFSFDLSVLEQYQKKGIGRQLITNAIKRYESEKSMYEEMGDYTRMKVYAVNANVARILENDFGFSSEPVAWEKGKPCQWYCYKY